MNIPIMNNHDIMHCHKIGLMTDGGIVRFNHPIPLDTVTQMFGNAAFHVLDCEQEFVGSKPAVLMVTAVKIIQWAAY
jgi:hypothetical protein